jgi:TRAP-type C4-dicarboxylate transport system substrate-binding protein
MSGWKCAGPVVVALLALAGCVGSDLDKSGGHQSPRILVLANNDGDGLAGVPSVQWFVDRVEALSGGSLAVRVDSSWTGGSYDEPRLVQDVAAGRADLGWTGTRSLDLAGAPAFAPLQAPFLVGSYARERAVIGDSQFVGDLLAELRPVGVLGLALTADEIRFPVGVRGPLRGPIDFEGLTFATFPSRVQSAAIQSLGATAIQSADSNAITGGTIGGFETMWWTYDEHNYAAAAPFATPNAGLWPRTVALFANPRMFHSLDSGQQKWIRQAAGEATAWSLHHAADRVAAQIATACAQGARIVTATAAQLRELRAAVQPVYSEMEADPTEAPYLDRITSLVAATGPDPTPVVPADCAYREGEHTGIPLSQQPLAGPGDVGSFPVGVYRMNVSAEALRRQGMPEHDVELNAGVYTFTLRAGRWKYHQDATFDSSAPTECAGWFDVRRDRVTFTTTSRYVGYECSPPVWTMRWVADGDRIHWSTVYGPPDFPGLADWTRVG